MIRQERGQEPAIARTSQTPKAMLLRIHVVLRIGRSKQKTRAKTPNAKVLEYFPCPFNISAIVLCLPTVLIDGPWMLLRLNSS